MLESLTTDVVFPACRLWKKRNDCENPGMPMQRKMWVLMLRNAVDVSHMCWHSMAFAKWLRVCFLHFSFSLSPFFSTSLFIQCAPWSAVWLMLPFVPVLAESGHRLSTSEMQNLGGHHSILQAHNKKCYSTCSANFVDRVRHSMTQAKPQRKHRFENGFGTGACHNRCVMIRPVKSTALGFLSKTRIICGRLLLLNRA